jgi:hypothetical protein
MSETVPTDRLDAWAAEQTCPRCRTCGLHVEWRLKARPPGDYSLAGVQTKFAATEVPWLVCPGCGVEVEGRRP